MNRDESKALPPILQLQQFVSVAITFVSILIALLPLTGCTPAPQSPIIDTAGLDPAVNKTITAAVNQVRKNPTSAEAWGELGSVLIHCEFHEETAAAFTHAEKLAPKDPRWPHLHGLALSNFDLAGASEKFQRSAKLAPPEFDAPALQLAQLQAERGLAAAAEAGFSELLRRGPQHAPARLGLARLRLASGQAQDATNLLAACLQDPHTARAAHSLMSSAQQTLGNPLAAKRFAAEASGLPADLPWPDPWWTATLKFRAGLKALLEDATAMMDQRKFPEAMALLEQATKEYPSDAESWYLIGWALVRQQRPAEGERALREHLRLTPQSPKGHAQLAVALLMQRRHSEAMDVLQKGIALKPTWREFHSNLGFACLQLGRTDEALAHYREALALDPNHMPTYTALAELLMRRNEQAKARLLLQQALEIEPSDSRALAILERINPTQ